MDLTAINTEVSEKQAEARKLHSEIMLNGQLAAKYLVDFCKDLKTMRDKQLYTELGFESFDDYVEQAVGIKKRMAYQYISTYESLGSTFLQSNAKIGITKLALMTKLPPEERLDLVESGEAESVTARELQEKIKELNSANEQLSLLQSEKEEAEEQSQSAQEKAESLRDEVERLKSELGESQKEKDEIFEELEEIQGKLSKSEENLCDEAESRFNEIKGRFEAEIIAKAEQNAKAETAKAVADAEQKLSEAHKQELERVRAESQKAVEALTDEKEEFKTRLHDLENQQKLTPDDPAVLKFRFYYDELKNIIQNMVAAANEMQDPETSEKLRAAAAKYLNIAMDKFNQEVE